jgi:NAD(P)-dependent dehydrogenase (short-subunit alcohol dehydrogenase family)
VNTAVIVGAGPGLGLSLGRKFGQTGMKVALIARKREKLDGLVHILKGEGIEAQGFVGNVDDPASITAALTEAEKRLGPIEVLEYSPLPGMGRDQNLMSALGTTVEMVERQYRRLVLGAVTSIKHVIPGMLERKRGALLVTTSGSGYFPMEILTPIGMAMAALRQYTLCLSQALSGTGIYVGTVCIAIVIRKGDPEADPDRIAQVYLDLYTQRDRTEVVLAGGSDNPQKAHLEDLLARGITPVFGTQAKLT